MKTLTVDEHRRVRLPGVKPKQVFAHEKGPDEFAELVDESGVFRGIPGM
jgi:hypothetical protein